MPNRRLPRVFGYRGKPPRSVAGSDLSTSSDEHLDGKYSHEEDYALKVANSYNNDGSSAAKAAESAPKKYAPKSSRSRRNSSSNRSVVNSSLNL